MKTVPYYWRLSAFYFFYFGSLGALVPYWSLYLKNLGFDAQEIGELIAIILATKLIAPNLWGWIADHTGRHIALVRISSLLTILCFLGIFIGDSYLWIAVIMGTFSFFWNAALPQMEATTLAHLNTQAYRYSHIRLWGSIGFIIIVMLFGWLFQHISVALLPTLLIGLFTSIWLTSWLVPEKKTALSSIPPGSFYQILKRTEVIALFLVCFLMLVSHGPYYTFYSIYLKDNGYHHDLIGQLWALGVIAEIGTFLILHHLLTRFSKKYLLIVSLGLTLIRWLLIGYYVESLSILLFAQLLHAASYGLYHGVAIHFIRQYFTDHYQGRAQALYSSVSFGAGGAVGSLVSGYTWEHIGAQMNYLGAAFICGVAIWISWQWVKHTDTTNERSFIKS